jgi:hypothetical protein
VSEPRKVVVGGCRSCPFARRRGEYPVCHASGNRVLENVWINVTPTTPPSWCPLRHGPVVVELEVQS